MKLKDKGFTLAELLIVIAIIAALVAIMIPTFGKSIETARENADVANLRAAFSEASTKHLLDKGGDKITITGVQLSSSGELEEVDVSVLPFTLPESFKFAKGKYTAVFDFSSAVPSVTLTPATGE